VEPGHFIFELLNQFAINTASFRHVVDTIERIISFTASAEAVLATAAAPQKSYALDAFATFLCRVFRTAPTPQQPGAVAAAAQHYRVLIHSPSEAARGGGAGEGGSSGATLSAEAAASASCASSQGMPSKAGLPVPVHSVLHALLLLSLAAEAAELMRLLCGVVRAGAGAPA
jgi:hypothetical protein